MRAAPAPRRRPIAAREIVFRDNLLAIFCAILVGCGLLLAH
jgi:hypothetical protein